MRVIHLLRHAKSSWEDPNPSTPSGPSLPVGAVPPARWPSTSATRESRWSSSSARRRGAHARRSSSSPRRFRTSPAGLSRNSTSRRGGPPPSASQAAGNGSLGPSHRAQPGPAGAGRRPRRDRRAGGPRPAPGEDAHRRAGHPAGARVALAGPRPRSCRARGVRRPEGARLIGDHRLGGEPAVPLAGGALIPLVGLGVWQIPSAGRPSRPWRGRSRRATRTSTGALQPQRGGGGAGGPGDRAPARGGARNDEDDARGRGSRAGAHRQPRAAGARLGRPVPHPLAHRPQRRGLARLRAASRAGLGPGDRRLQLRPRPAAAARRPGHRAAHGYHVNFSPFAFAPEVFEAHRRAGVVLEAYSPLARGRRIDHPVIAEVARRHGRTPARSYCAGPSSATSPPSQSPDGESASSRTTASSTSPSQTRTWLVSTHSDTGACGSSNAARIATTLLLDGGGVGRRGGVPFGRWTDRTGASASTSSPPRRAASRRMAGTFATRFATRLGPSGIVASLDSMNDLESTGYG